MSRVEHKDPIIEQLRKARRDRDVSVMELSEILGVPADRIYKWDQGKAAPKFEDRQKVEKWIAGKLEEKVPREKEMLSKSSTNDEQMHAGTISAREYIDSLKEHNEWLRRNFETSLKAIRGAQNETGSHLKALTWYATQVANKEDQPKADQDLLRIYSKLASYEGVEDEDDSSQTDDKKRTSAKRKVGK